MAFRIFEGFQWWYLTDSVLHICPKGKPLRESCTKGEKSQRRWKVWLKERMSNGGTLLDRPVHWVKENTVEKLNLLRVEDPNNPLHLRLLYTTHYILWHKTFKVSDTLAIFQGHSGIRTSVVINRFRGLNGFGSFLRRSKCGLSFFSRKNYVFVIYLQRGPVKSSGFRRRDLDFKFPSKY